MSADAPLVTAILPAYSHAAFVAGAMRSVAAQDHAALELVVVDDASPDDTAGVAESLLAGEMRGRFARAAVLRRPANGGAAAALNDGIAWARGRVLAFLNSDDEWAPGRLSRLLAAMEAAGSGLGFSNVEFLGEAAADPWFLGRELRISADAAAGPTLGFALLRGNLALSSGNIVWDRARAGEAPLFAPLAYCADWDFLLQGLCATEPAFVDAPLYRYRLHGGNSFRALAPRAALETEIARRRFLAACDHAANPLCPSPRNWPGVFEAAVAAAAWPAWNVTNEA